MGDPRAQFTVWSLHLSTMWKQISYHPGIKFCEGTPVSLKNIFKLLPNVGEQYHLTEKGSKLSGTDPFKVFLSELINHRRHKRKQIN